MTAHGMMADAAGSKVLSFEPARRWIRTIDMDEV